ncbi:hypothetical protein [Paenibacillus protaetiae]|uniref:Uncharacterized protein n=1 Tax=Paenibacillus protaetiae TaxID=2509456 RepID=A0A4P6ETR8_9BACL|nr:hypothetical protein [Paenibacillus protaetiae]QAY66304.1 hypothetical protein ET464_07710 [Paenibacillus protaetiae]
MEKLIAFLSSNIFFIVVIIGIIAKIVGGSRKQRPRGGMPTFGGGADRSWPGERERRYPHPQEEHERNENSRDEENWREAPYEPAPKQAEEPPRSAVQPPGVSPFSGAYPAQSRSQAASQPAPPARHGHTGLGVRQNAQGAARQPKAQPAKSPVLRASEEDLRRAVVWSEILGPPRAKKPFRK